MIEEHDWRSAGFRQLGAERIERRGDHDFTA